MASISYFITIFFILIVLLYSLFKRNNAYDSFIEGCKESIKDGIGLLPYLLVMYVCVNVFNNSGILSDLISLNFIPKEIILQGVFRPVSSHASLSMMVSIINIYGVDSKEGIISTILQGGTDTTLYVMGLYFGYAKIKKSRHAYFVGLICDLICFIAVIVLFFLI